MTDHVPDAGHPPPSDDIGAISEDDGPTKKRMRVSRACDPCRRRKERCDGSQPSCQRCNKAGRPCSYIPYRKRGLRTGYVRGIEIILGLLIHSCAGTEDLILAVLRHKTNQNTSSIGATSAPPAISLLESWRKSKAHEDLQRALVSSDDDEDEEMYLQNLDDKLTSAFNLLPRQPRNEDFQDLSESAEVAERVPDAIPLPTEVTPQSLSQNAAVVDTLPSALDLSQPNLPPNWSQLIEIYLTNTHCWLPVIQKYTLYRSASLLSGAGGSSHGTKPSQGEMCSLWAVLAYASHQLSAADASAGPPGVPLVFLAKQLATQSQMQYEAGHVHALLTLTLLDISQNSWMSAWLLIGRAVQISASLGIIPIRQGQPNLDGDDSRRRLALGCFVVETLVASKLGLRPYLRQSDLSDVGNLTSDGIEEWEVWRPMNLTITQVPVAPSGPGRVLSTFNHLCYIVGVLNSLISPVARGNRTTNLQQYLQHLQEWNDGNPLRDCLSVFKDRARQSSEAPHTLQLRLAAMATYAFLSGEDNQANAVLGAGLPNTQIRNSLGETQRILTDPGTIASIVDSTQFFPGSRIFLDLVQQNTKFTSEPLSPSILNPPFVQPENSTQSCNLTPQRTNDSMSVNERMLIPSSTLQTSRLFSLNGQESFQPRSIPSQPLALSHVPKPAQHLHSAGMHSSVNTRSSPNTSTDQSNCITQLGAVPTPPLSTQSIDAQLTGIGLESQNTMSTVSLSETSDQNGLFNQLSLLDRADWPVFSEDFMEHLGLSRDGSLLDYQNLFAPS